MGKEGTEDGGKDRGQRIENRIEAEVGMGRRGKASRKKRRRRRKGGRGKHFITAN